MVSGDLSRRRLLATGAASVGSALAGCASGVWGTDEGSLSFDDGVDPEMRERTQEVYRRTEELVGRQLRTETTVEVIDVEEMRRRAGGIEWLASDGIERLAYHALGLIDDVDTTIRPEYAGLYDPERQFITLVERPEGRISDQLIAHELIHAMQHQDAPTSTWDWSDGASLDRREAQRGLLEGTAKHAEAEYADGCDEFASCALGPAEPAPLDRWDDEWLLTFGAHVNGHELAEALADRGGWEEIWEAHEHPPTHTGQVLKPEWYPDNEPELVEARRELGSEWSLVGADRLGMRAAFVALWLGEGIPEDEIYTGSESDTDNLFSRLLRYRSPVTDAWRGDQFVGYEHDAGEYAWCWALRFSDTDATGEAAEAFEDRASSWGSATDDAVWERDGRYQAVASDGRDLFVGEAPDRETLAALDASFAD